MVLFSQTRVKRQIFETFRAGSTYSPCSISSIFVLFFVLLTFFSKGSPPVFEVLSWPTHFCLSRDVLPGSHAKCSRANFSLIFVRYRVQSTWLSFLLSPTSTAKRATFGHRCHSIPSCFSASDDFRVSQRKLAISGWTSTRLCAGLSRKFNLISKF